MLDLFRFDGVTSFADLPVADLDTRWQWNATVANEVLGDNNWDRFRRAHLWVDTAAIQERGEPTRQDFKLPFARMFDGTLRAVWKGLVAGRQRIPNTDISADDKKAAQRHVDRYVRKINKALPEGEEPKPLSSDGVHEEEEEEKKDGWVERVDLDPDGPLLRPTMREDGTLLMTGRVARPGVLLYQLANGTTRRELVLPEDLHRADALGTLGRAAVTLEHPKDPVSPDTVKEVGVGDVDGEVHVEADGFVTVRLAVRRRDAIDAIMAGKVQLSPGYIVRIEEQSGVHPIFGRFDAIQRDRRYNHLAVVDRARGGASVRLRTDGAAYQVQGDSMDPKLIALLTLLGVERFDDEGKALDEARERADKSITASVDLGALKSQFDDQAKAIEKLTKDVEKITGERDALQKQVDDAKTAAQTKADAAERESLDELRQALKMDAVGDEANDALMRRITGQLLGKEIREDADATYMRGVIDTFAASSAKREDGAANPWKTFNMDTKEPKPKPKARKDGAPSLAGSYIKRANDAFNTSRAGRSES